MTPQCNPILHYTKQPLLTQRNNVAFINGNNNNTNNNKSKSKSEKSRKKRIKCVIVGDKAVGKTSLAVSYSNDTFPSEYVPTAYDNYNVEVQVNNRPVRVELCDTAGEDEFGPLRHLCYPGTDVFMLCFSVIKPKTFQSACTRWADELTRLGATVVLVGTQADLVNNLDILHNLRSQGLRPVSPTDAQQLADKLNAPYVETSAKTCSRLKEAFDQAIIIALRQQKKEKWWKPLCCIPS